MSKAIRFALIAVLVGCTVRALNYSKGVQNTPIHCLPGTGQSLSTGTLDPVESTSQPFHNLKLFDSASVYTSGAVPGTFSLIPLVTPLRLPLTVSGADPYPDNLSGESVETSTVNQITRLALADGAGEQQWIADCFGQGGAPMSVIKKGGSGNAYAASLHGVSVAQQLVSDPALFTVDAVLLTHGHADSQNQNASYQSQLATLGSDYDADMRAITGQAAPVPIVMSQQNSQPSAGAGFNYTALAMLALAQSQPTKFFLSGPLYQYQYADAQHLRHYPTLGDKYAQVIRSIQKTGTWAPLWPTNFARASNVVTVTFHVPVVPLVFDGAQVGPHASGVWSLWGRTGFEAYDQVAAVSNCTLAGGTTGLVTVQTSAPHGYSNSTQVAFNNVGGCNNINQVLWSITVIDSTHFSLNGSNGNGAFIGTTNRVFVPIGITSAVVSGSTVVLTLARPPVGSTLQIGYADLQDGVFGTQLSGFGTSGRCGLLRDSDPDTGNSGFANVNWCVEFSQNVP